MLCRFASPCSWRRDERGGDAITGSTRICTRVITVLTVPSDRECSDIWTALLASTTSTNPLVVLAPSTQISNGCDHHTISTARRQVIFVAGRMQASQALSAALDQTSRWRPRHTARQMHLPTMTQVPILHPLSLSSRRGEPDLLGPSAPSDPRERSEELEPQLRRPC